MVAKKQVSRNKSRARICCMKSVTSISNFQEYVTEKQTMTVPFGSIFNEVHRNLEKQAKALMPIKGPAYKRRDKQESIVLKETVEPMSMYSKYFNQKLDMKTTFNNIIADVHSTMKSANPPQRAITKPPQPTNVIATAPLEEKPSLSRSKSQSKMRIPRHRIAGGQNRPKFASSIPISKANIDRNSLIAMRRGLTPSMLNEKNFTYQRRIREVMQQKSVLETMLKEHKKLQRDRLNIAMDIQRMRNDLDRIRQKLDVSLQSLKCTQTFASRLTGSGVNPNKSIRSDSLKTCPKPARSSVGGKTKSKKPLFKSGNVTAKLQLAPRRLSTKSRRIRI